MTSFSFDNPDNLPSEQLKLKASIGGVVQYVNAIDPHWVEKRELTLYVSPPDSNETRIGATDAWLIMAENYLEDMKWLLRMEQHRFWSHILHHETCMDCLVSFLQEANPPYMEQYSDKNVLELYTEISRRVLIVFSRLITNKESQSQWLSKEYISKVIYDKYIFSMPTILDICLIYAIGNRNHVQKLVSNVFQLQPNYLNDLKTTILFVKETFKYITSLVNKDYDTGSEPINLPTTFKGFTQDFNNGLKDPKSQDKLTFDMISDLVVHCLDTVITLRLFIDMYNKSASVIKDCGFILSIAQFYDNTIPHFYENLESVGDNRNVKYYKIREYIDCIRAESVDLLRSVLDCCRNDIFNDVGNTDSKIEEYLCILMEALSEKLFIKDYHICYPVDEDLEMIKQVCPNIDSVKTDFILQAIYSNMDDQQKPTAVPESNSHVSPEPSNVTEATLPEEVTLESQISEVKDIFPELGDGFIHECLKFYNFDGPRVINCILEDNLDVSLRNIDRTLPLIPEDPLDKQFLETGITRLNVFDGDQFDIMTRDDIDLSKINIGKKRSEYRNLKEMLDDKSFVRERKNVYEKYNMISDEVDVYNDEYDDTYDDDGVALRLADGTTDEIKPLNVKAKRVSSSESEESEGENQQTAGGSRSKPLDFCVNPESVRERREQNFRLKNQRNVPSRGDVVGRARGQGQSKEVLNARRRKDENKSSRANHNRRSGAQWKRSQGLMPS